MLRLNGQAEFVNDKEAPRHDRKTGNIQLAHAGVEGTRLIMNKQNVHTERFGCKNNELFAEIGSYFAADGSFSENEFRQSLQKSLAYMKEQSKDDSAFSGTANRWLSAKLLEIIDYLHEKDMPEASFRLFKTAIEECASLGLPDISLPTEYLAYILSHAADIRPKREKIDASNVKRERIIDAALKVFARDGFYRATMDDVAKLADVGKGSVYRYFKNKDDLLKCIIIEHTEEILEHISAMLSQEVGIVEQIQRVIQTWVTFIANHHELYGLIQNNIQIHDTNTRDLFFTHMLSKLPMLKEKTISLNRDHQTRVSNLTFDTIFMGSFGFVDWVYYKWLLNGKAYDLRDEVPIIVDMLLHGCIVETRN